MTSTQTETTKPKPPLQIFPNAKAVFSNVSTNMPEWKAARHTLIGSSELTTIVGLNPFESALELWCRKTGKTPEIESTPAMEYGRDVEPAIANLFEKAHPEYELFNIDDMFVMNDHEWAAATPDRVIVRSDDKAVGLVEIKHTGYAHPAWEDDGAPDYAHVQLIWQLGVLGCKFGHIAAVVAGKPNDAKDPLFEFDASLFGQLLERAEKFREMCIADTPPDPGVGDRALVESLIERHDDKVAQLDAAADAWIDKWQTVDASLKKIRAQEKELHGQREIARANITMMMGDAMEGVTLEGKRVKMKFVKGGSYSGTRKDSYRFSIKEA